MNGLADSIAWPTRDPEWVSKILLVGLINLIPIAGQMVLFGWMLTALDNLRAGRAELPPAGFHYIGRGVNLFVVWLVYGVAVVIVFAALFTVGLVFSLGRDGGFLPGLFFILLGYAALLVGAIGLYVMSPAIILATDRGGIGGGLDLPALIARAGANGPVAVYAGLFSLVAYLIGGVGAIACGVGQILTMPYGYAILASVVRYYEQNAAPPGMPTPVG